ncbi:hypothetical protein FS749_002687 [Ceratobasidium sp. UAMH 11750]|nr:hypothetical protein FS749_002687 [Ceratobasidium sp. UAMH 11750]
MDQSPVNIATKWFAAYTSGDYEGMKALAAPNYVFEDPAFGRLEVYDRQSSIGYVQDVYIWS